MTQGPEERGSIVLDSQQSKLMFNTMLQGVVFQDATGRIISMNPAAERILGKTPDEFIGQTSTSVERDCIRADGSIFPGMEHPAMLSLETGKEHRDVIMGVFNPRERAYRWISVTAVPIFQPGNERPDQVYTIFEDVTERRNAEEELVHMNKELMRSNEDLQQFAYVASHDLKEPLRMISGFLGLLEQRSNDKLDPDSREYLRMAKDGAERMDDLIEDLLQFSRIGRATMKPECTSMEEVYRQAKTNLAHQIETSGATVSRGPLPTLYVDRLQMTTLMQNLLGNAIKFRGIEPPIVDVSAEKSGESWVFAVKDNGIGFPPEYRERIFLMFERLHRQEMYPGTGIGLAICKKIMDRHGGTIWAESREGFGSTFYFSIPTKAKMVHHC